jgi:hypothetical protein
MWPAILNAALERTKIEEEGVKITSSMDKDFFVAKSERERDELACECGAVTVEREMAIRPAHGMIACRSRWVGDGIPSLRRPREHYA